MQAVMRFGNAATKHLTAGASGSIAGAVAVNVADEMKDNLRRLANGMRRAQVNRVRRELPDRIRSAYRQAMLFAANNLIGVPSNNAWPGDTDVKIVAEAIGQRAFFTTAATASFRGEIFRGEDEAFEEEETLSWPSLSPRYMRSKGNDRFFIKTGALQQEIRNFAHAFSRSGNVARIGIYHRGKKGQFGSRLDFDHIELNIRLLPDLPSGALPGLASGNINDVDPSLSFEQSLGITGETLEKLRGPVVAEGGERNHRPLLQPVITFWTVYRIPYLIGNTIRNTLKA